nr:hypothetical protein [Chryseobacterium sp. RR2-3-20]
MNEKGEGMVKAYHSNGKPKRTCNYTNGNRDGECKEYYEDGQLKMKITYKKGKLEDGSEYFKEDGSPDPELKKLGDFLDNKAYEQNKQKGKK